MKMKKNSLWPVRAVQLDLARQNESFDTIRQFAVFAKEWGYNAIVLYVEGIIRTRSFPHRARIGSYEPHEMKRIVRMMVDLGLEVIPAINILGHSEHFFEYKPLKSLREEGHWCSNMFCTSNPKTHQFLEKYIHELMPLFPGKNVHVGCDETWALGACPVCRQRIQKGKIKEDLLVGHICHYHQLLKKRGKRVWIWGDMFYEDDEGSSRLRQLPRDIVLCDWRYSSEQMSYDGFQGHFNNLRRLNSIKLANDLGFETVICPWANGLENTTCLTQTAREYKVAGGLQTIWELSRIFLQGTYPMVAFTGALWCQPGKTTEEVLEGVLRKLFPSVTDEVRVAVALLMTENGLLLASCAYYLRGGLTLDEARSWRAVKLAEKTLCRAVEPLAEGLERDLLGQMHLLARYQVLSGNLRKALPDLIDPRFRAERRLAARRAIQECLKEMDDLKDRNVQDWKTFRAGQKENRASAFIGRLRDELQGFVDLLEKVPLGQQGLLQVRLFLWDQYSAPRLKIELSNGVDWKQVYKGCFKAVNNRDAQFLLQVPVEWKGQYPEKIRLSVSGYGGQGVSYFNLAFKNKTLVPTGVIQTNGDVERADAVLIDDSTVCFLGSADTVRTLRQYRDEDVSLLEMTLG